MAAIMNVYEGMFLLGPIGAAEPENAMQMVRSVIEKHDGQIIVLKKWDERKLAYEIAGQKRGTYIISYFKAPSTAVAHIERDVKLSEDILRVIVLRSEHLNEQEMNAVEPQPIMPKEERNPWDRPDFNNDRPRRESRPRREEAPAESEKQ